MNIAQAQYFLGISSQTVTKSSVHKTAYMLTANWRRFFTGFLNPSMHKAGVLRVEPATHTKH